MWRKAVGWSGYRLNPNFIDVLMRKFDRTGTGRVNFDDFIQLCVVLQVLPILPRLPFRSPSPLPCRR